MYDLDSPSSGYQQIEIDEGGVRIHPDYRGCDTPEWSNVINGYKCRGGDNDIALLKLKTAVSIGGQGATKTGIISLAETNLGNLASTIAYVTGWGRAGTWHYPTKLHTVDLEIRANCGSWNVNNNMLCAGSNKPGKGACDGDSGGPLVIFNNGTWNLVGIVSTGNPDVCGNINPDFPDLFTRVSSHREWIRCQMSLCAPQLQSPANTRVTSIRPTFDWAFNYWLNKDNAPIGYAIQISRSPNFDSNEILEMIECTTEVCTYYAPEQNFANGTTYYWRVWSLRGEESSEFSETWQFTTVSNPPPPIITPIPNDTTPPTVSSYTAYASVGTANLSVSNVNDPSGIREVRFSAKFNNRWVGIGNDTTTPYGLAWDMCAWGVPDGDVELGMEVWDNAGNVYIWSQHYPNPHITKSHNCAPPQQSDGVYLYPNDGLDPSRGGECRVTQDAPSLTNYCGNGWNDNVESVRTVGPYRAVLFKDDLYGGGEPLYIDFTAALPDAWRNQASSIRVRRIDNPAFTLYSLGDYNGENWPSDRTIYDLGHWRWNDKAQSIRVHAGYSVIVCSDADFKNVCGRATGPNQWSDINALAQGLRDGVSSIRVCPGSCPDAGPNPTFYYPTSNQTVDGTQPLSLRWGGDLNQFFVELWGGALDGKRQYGWTNDVAWNIGTLPISANPYYWRVKGWRGYGETGWTEGRFYVAMPDTTQPTGKMTGPSRFGYRNENTITLRADAADSDSGVAQVEFFTWLSDKWEFLGTDTMAPYEYIWNTSSVREGGLWVSANIVDKAGNSSGLIWEPDWVFFTIDHTPPSSAVLPLPETVTTEQFTVRWNGIDNYTPNDLIFYDVQYQLDCTGEWLDWYVMGNMPGASFNGQMGHSYCFRSRAYDLPGNTEAWSDQADAHTQIVSNAPTPTSTPTPTATPDPAQPVTPTPTATATKVNEPAATRVL
jgi:hypothetical protein